MRQTLMRQKVRYACCKEALPVNKDKLPKFQRHINLFSFEYRFKRIRRIKDEVFPPHGGSLPVNNLLPFSMGHEKFLLHHIVYISHSPRFKKFFISKTIAYILA